MDQGLISHRYAKALYEYAQQRQEAEALYDTMRELAKQLAALPALRRTLDSPMVDTQTKLMLITEAAGEGAPQSYRDFANMVLENHREKFLQKMALSYADIFRKRNNICVVSLTSVTAMPTAILERIRQSVAKKSNGTVEFETSIDPTLQGGFIFQIDDLRLDASVRGQLDKIRRQFEQNSSIIV